MVLQVGKGLFSVLENEKLISSLQRRSPPPTNVRIVPDPLRRNDDASSPSTTEIVTLDQAIQRALDEDLDIIEISLQQETPVVTLSKLGALKYHQKRKAKLANSTKGSNPGSVRKEIVLKASIAENDFVRKVADTEKFMLKGHPVGVTVKAMRRELARNPEAVMETCHRFLDRLKSRAEVVYDVIVPPKITDPDRKNMVKFSLRAGSNKAAS